MFRHLRILIITGLTLALALQFQGCTKDPIESLVGTWNFKSIKFTSIILGEVKLEGSGTFTFNADGTGNVDYQVIDQGNVQAVEGDIMWTATKDQVTIAEENKLVIYQRLVNRSKKQVISYYEGASTAEITLTR
ncbi:MAG: lipocalin family protein [Saprospiraceae bacterium]|nr:lipocalin family protein [Saprospiraceae bacterium]MCB9320195.1 lipocalin family protein [Lewinellaceae bacterium]